jgi:hypothetical protein
MTAFSAQTRPLHFLIVCAAFIVSLAGLAAGLRPAEAADVTRPAATAVPAAPAAAFASQAKATPGALAAVPQPVPVPTAPGSLAEEAGHQANLPKAASLPAGGSTLPVLAVAVASVLLAGAARRRMSLAARTAAC